MTGCVSRHQKSITASLKDVDISIRRRALDLLFTMCTPSTAADICAELLKYLEVADFSLRDELVLKIAILAERSDPGLLACASACLPHAQSADACAAFQGHQVLSAILLTLHAHALVQRGPHGQHELRSLHLAVQARLVAGRRRQLCACRFYPDLHWYVDVMLALIERAAEGATKDVWHSVVQLITSFPDLHQYAAEKASPALCLMCSLATGSQPRACHCSCWAAQQIMHYTQWPMHDAMQHSRDTELSSSMALAQRVVMHAWLT